MTRITNIDDLLFPVELTPVYTEIKIQGVTKKLEVPNHRIVLNQTTGTALGVVSDNYELISNKKAIELGKKCCIELFGEVEANNIEVFNVDAPSTASYCHIDLVHNAYIQNLYDEKKKSDIYIPYVRITNSYNTLRALRFDIGLCRKLCLNGMIFESETIRFTFSHVKHEFKGDISFAVEEGKIKKLIDKFFTYTNKLKDQYISIDRSFDIVRILFGIRDITEIELADKRQSKQEYEALLAEIDNKLTKYCIELGDNSYALFNTITDLASHPIKNRYFRRDMNSMQRLAGNWINSFNKAIEKPDFKIDTYIKELSASSNQAIELD